MKMTRSPHCWMLLRLGLRLWLLCLLWLLIRVIMMIWVNILVRLVGGIIMSLLFNYNRDSCSGSYRRLVGGIWWRRRSWLFSYLLFLTWLIVLIHYCTSTLGYGSITFLLFSWSSCRYWCLVKFLRTVTVSLVVMVVSVFKRKQSIFLKWINIIIIINKEFSI